MATISKFDLVLPDIPYNGNKVILEYVFVNNTQYQLQCKTRIVDTEPKTFEGPFTSGGLNVSDDGEDAPDGTATFIFESDCPIWDNYMWNDREGTKFQEMILKPVAMFENPFFRSPHKLVLCDFWVTLDEPAAINTRQSCKKTMERLKCDPATGHKPKQPHEPWFGIEQEYFVTGEDGYPISYNPKENDYEKLIIYTKIGHQHDWNIGVERQLSDRHLMACLYAGVEIGGRIRENGPSQWEFQIGPCLEESIGDHLNVARYILLRLSEMFGVRVTFHPVPVHGAAFASGGHLNFSTSKMREKGGIKFIKHAINVLSKSNQEPLLRMYDPTPKEENKERLLNASGHWHPRMDDFTADVANKELTTIRIPPLVNERSCGYFEDRRPSSDIDPYAASEGIVRACIFGDFLKPEFESLKDLSVWDKDEL